MFADAAFADAFSAASAFASALAAFAAANSLLYSASAAFALAAAASAFALAAFSAFADAAFASVQEAPQTPFEAFQSHVHRAKDTSLISQITSRTDMPDSVIAQRQCTSVTRARGSSK